MGSRNRALIYLAVAGLAAAAWLHFLAPAYLAQRLLLALQTASGRSVLAEAGAGYRLLPAPAIIVRGLSIANPGGSGSGSLLAANRASAEIDLAALLLGRIEAHRVVLEAPLVNLTIDAQGAANWRRRGADAPVLSSPALVELDGARVVYRDEASGEQVTLEGLSARIRPGGGEIEAEGSAEWRGERVAWSLQTTASDLLAGERPVPVRFNLAARHGSATFGGNAKLMGGATFAGRGTLQGPSVARLADWLGVSRPELAEDTAQPFLVSGPIELSAGRLALREGLLDLGGKRGTALSFTPERLGNPQ